MQRLQLLFLACLCASTVVTCSSPQHLRDVQEIWRIEGAIDDGWCQTSSGHNNWGVFYDSYAYQEILWSQSRTRLSLWDVSNCSATRHLSSLITESPECPYLDTVHSRGSFYSTAPPGTPCGCTPTQFDTCVHQMRVSDVRCGATYRIDYSAAAEWLPGDMLADGQSISAPGRVAMDLDISGGSSADACSPLSNRGEMVGHWCVVRRGGCPLATKVHHCAQGDPVGVLLLDNVPGDRPTSTPGPFPGGLLMPVLMISADDAARLQGSFGSSVFTVSKSIGPLQAPVLAAAGLRTAEHRSLTSASSQVIGAAGSRRFFREPNRPYGWSFGVSQVSVLDMSDEGNPRLLHTFQDESWPLDWAFGSRGFHSFFFVTRRQGELLLVDVTDPSSLSVAGALPSSGGSFFLSRDSSTLYQQRTGPGQQPIQGYRYQEAWDISKTDCPILMGSFTLDIAMHTVDSAGLSQLSHATPDRSGSQSNLVSFNLGDDGVAFYDYSEALAPRLAAYVDVSPSSCAPPGVGGASGFIVPSTGDADVWLMCQEWEEEPLFSCTEGARQSADLEQCQPAQKKERRVDLVALRVLPKEVPQQDCEDGAIVNLHFLSLANSNSSQ